MTCRLRSPCLTVLALAALGAAEPLRASDHAVSRADVLRAIEEARAVPFHSLQAKVQERMPGTLVDVGLFDFGTLYCRVLVRQADGRLISAVIDARSGDFLPVSTATARAVQHAARTDRTGGGAPQTRPAPAAGGTAAASGTAAGSGPSDAGRDADGGPAGGTGAAGGNPDGPSGASGGQDGASRGQSSASQSEGAGSRGQGGGAGARGGGPGGGGPEDRGGAPEGRGGGQGGVE